jgi:hypothetical protein
MIVLSHLYAGSHRVSPGFEGIFRFEARLMNRSERSLSGLMVAVTTVTHGHLLHNADGGPWGVGGEVGCYLVDRSLL